MPVPHRRFLPLALGLALLLAAASAVGADDPGEALREAARAGDVARVDALLAAGAPVDAPARYGQTPLYFAAEKGHLAAARRLVERGANVNAQDSFFGASVLGMALSGGHLELARYLLAHGAEDAASALGTAIESDDLELARAALATGLLEPLDLAAARREVEQVEGRRRAGACASCWPRRPRSRGSARRTRRAPERLSAYAGRYREEAGKEATVAVRGDGLGLTLRASGGDGPRPRWPRTASTAPTATCRWSSAGAAGLVEWAQRQPGRRALASRRGDRRPDAAALRRRARRRSDATAPAEPRPPLAAVPRPAAPRESATARARPRPGTSRPARACASRRRSRASACPARSSGATGSSSPPR